MTKTVPLPPSSNFASPKSVMLSEAAFIDEHHRLLELPAFQRAISMGVSHYQRAMAAALSGDPTADNYMQASAIVAAKMQGAQEVIQCICQLAEIPPPMPQRKDADNLEN